ncbi:CAP domain-containing protein [Brevibacillus sp. H7]|uniref:CAP domain-containing protein n=1 Tax=Brevibacillus sp. H7 TaxID=3349138 RepID=UPI0038238BA4
MTNIFSGSRAGGFLFYSAIRLVCICFSNDTLHLQWKYFSYRSYRCVKFRRALSAIIIAKLATSAASRIISSSVSSGHRRNLLNANFKQMGAGVSLQNGKRFYTQNFMTRQ